ncbi:MAG: hypothetical protein HYY92_00880 [Parcubacteria group bacterium]|nr:hypothetical protein [Parcubacteria group bacterium]
MSKTFEVAIRKAAMAWARTATIDEISKVIPFRFVLEANTSRKGTAKSQGATPATRVVRKVNHVISAEEKARVLERILGKQVGSPEYKTAVRDLSRELRITPRQIGGVMSAINRAAKNSSPLVS